MNHEEGHLKRRYLLDRFAHKVMVIPVVLISAVLVMILGLLLLHSRQVLSLYPLDMLLLSSSWKPLAGEFGFYPFISATVWVTCLAMLFSVPVSLFTAIYLSEYARPGVRKTVQPFIDLLAGIPSVVYGLFGILLIVPFIRDTLSPIFGGGGCGYSVLAGGMVLSIMVLPILISVIYEVLSVVPSQMREASLALGANQWETTKYVVLKKGLTGIFAGVILGFSRAFGETMAVLMVVGNVAKVPSSVFDPAYPIPALIANNYGEMMSVPIYDSALMFAALLLFVMVVGFNLVSKYVLLKFKGRMA